MDDVSDLRFTIQRSLGGSVELRVDTLEDDFAEKMGGGERGDVHQEERAELGDLTNEDTLLGRG